MLETLWRKLQWSSLPPPCAISTASPQRSKLNTLLEGKHTFFLAMSAFFLLSLLDSPVSNNHHKIWLKDELNFGHGKKWGFFLLIYVTPPTPKHRHTCVLEWQIVQGDDWHFSKVEGRTTNCHVGRFFVEVLNWKGWIPCFSSFWQCDILQISSIDSVLMLYDSGPELILVIDITDYIRGEKSVMWRNFRFM